MKANTAAHTNHHDVFNWDELKAIYNPQCHVSRVPANYRRRPGFKGCSAFQRMDNPVPHSPFDVTVDTGNPAFDPHSPDAITTWQIRDARAIKLVNQLWDHIQADGLDPDQIRQCIMCRFAHRGPDDLIGVPVICERGSSREAWNIPFHREE